MMKKVLVFTSFYKPGFLGGGPIQSIANLLELLDGSFRFHVLTHNYDLGVKANPYNIPKNKWLKENNNSFLKYLSDFQFFFVPFFIILRLRPDVIYFNSFFSEITQINLIFSRFYCLFNSNCKIVIAPRGEFDEGAFNIKRKKKDLFLKIFKFFGFRRLRFHATSKIEMTNIQDYFPGSNTLIAGNIPKLNNKKNSRVKKIGESNFIFYSRITRKKNLLFAIKLFSNIKIEGNIKLTIVGPIEDKIYFEDCLRYLNQLPSNIIFDVVGAKSPVEIESILNYNHFFLFPTLGENYGHVIYESLISGLPILISNNTPWKGKNDDNAIFEYSLDNPIDFIDCIKYLHGLDNEKFQELSDKAVLTAKSSFDINIVRIQYSNLFNHANSK